MGQNGRKVKRPRSRRRSAVALDYRPPPRYLLWLRVIGERSASVHDQARALSGQE